MVTWKFPVTVGVPVIAPVEPLIESPAGKPVAVQPVPLLIEPVPIVMLLVIEVETSLYSLYESGSVVIVGPEFTARDSALVAISPAESTSCTVKLKTPLCVGVPVISPVSGFSDIPAGSAPAEIDQAPVDGIVAVP